MYILTIFLYEICWLRQYTSGATLQFSLIFLMKNKNSVLSSPSQTLNALFFLMKAKLLGYIPCNFSNASFCSQYWQCFSSVRPLPVCRSQSCFAVRGCTEWVDSSHRASFMSQLQRKESFTLQPHTQVLPGGLLRKRRTLGLFPWSWHLFSYRACSWQWEKEEATQVSSSLCNHCRLL